MPRIPLPAGLKGTENLPRTRRSLVNCWNNGDDIIIQRPGMGELNTTNRVARGSFTWNNSLYIVATNDLLKVTDKETGAFTVIGNITGSETVIHDIGFNEAVLVVKGVASYTLDKSDNLVNTTNNPNFVPFIDVAHINQRFIFIPADGGPAKFSDVGDGGTIQPLSFVDAEEITDPNNGCFNFRNTLYITGTDSIETFRDTGETPNPFARVPGSRIQNGVIGGILEYNNTFLFIGREKDQDYGIYSITQGAALKISNETIDLILSKYTISQLAEAIPNRFKWRGYDIATFTLPNDSFGFFGGQWFLLQSLVDERLGAWAAGYITQFEGEYYTAFLDKIGVLRKVNTDYGERITRIIDTAVEQENDDWFSIQSVNLGLSQGYNSGIGSVALMMSRDNVQYSDPLYRNTGEIGQYQNKLEWNYPGGLGSYRGFAGIRFYSTENIECSSDHLVVETR